MGVVRNFIDIIGIKEDIPLKFDGYTIEYEDKENIFIPKDSGKIDVIYQIVVDLEVKSHRVISLPTGKVCVIDGIKKIKIVYTDIEQKGKANILELKLSFNVSVNLPHRDIHIEDIDIFLADAYFDKINEEIIYGYYLYIINISHSNINTVLDISKDNTYKFKVTFISEEDL